MATVALIVLVVAVLAAAWAVVAYNRIVTVRNRADSSWSQVDVELRRRRDLVPKLVETVSGYATHERETLDRVATARSAAEQATGPAEASPAEGSLGAAVGRLLAVGEAYPELRAQERFSELVRQLHDTEGRIAIARQVYNDTALTYNNRIQTAPTSLLAWALRLRPMAYFEPEGAGA
jgi:LemA protein